MRMMKLKRTLSTLLALGLCTLLTPTRAAAEDPQVIVKSTTDQVLQAIEEGGQDRNHVYSVVEQMVLPHFDFRKMSTWVLGKNWRQGTPEQQDRFVSEFQKLLVRTYSTALIEYKGQEIRYLPTQSDGDGKIATVRTQVQQGGGHLIPIDYRLYSAGSDWKVFDVAVDGVSLVANYRTTFNEEIRSKGFDGLVEDLAAKNAR
ncbi:MAG: ABC transporter substrate-binding protein [Gammaproteobacteria bacterium]